MRFIKSADILSAVRRASCSRLSLEPLRAETPRRAAGNIPAYLLVLEIDLGHGVNDAVTDLNYFDVIGMDRV
ncbi:MAG TPA: hypothetical protein VLN44_09975, partial [Pyrinomonadaceae bacterium]|nr:hypothetical protein [Pyrinomonadaceae bacterium]